MILIDVEGDGCWQAAHTIAEAQPENIVPLDIILKTPESAKKRFLDGAPFIRSAFNHGKVLYERAG